MKAKPSDFSGSSKIPLRESLGVPVLAVTSRKAPSRQARGKVDVAYGIDSLEKLVETFEQREGALKQIKGL